MGHGDMGNGEMGNGEMGKGHVDPHQETHVLAPSGE